MEHMATKKYTIYIFKYRTPNPPTHARIPQPPNTRILSKTNPEQHESVRAVRANRRESPLCAPAAPPSKHKGEAAVAFRWWGIGS